MKGTPKWWDVRVTPLAGPDGRPYQLLSIARDVTEVRRAEEQRLSLTHELQHRLENTLAMVGAIASQTFSNGGASAAARDAFSTRLVILGQASDILTQSSWAATPIHALVEGAVAPHRTGQGRFHIDGPSVSLAAKPALSLALASSELATNATKYGALSNADGRVTIRWEILGEQFHLRWSEKGGPLVELPTRRGFGSRVVERGLSQEFGGQVRINFEATGVTCELTAQTRAICEA